MGLWLLSVRLLARWWYRAENHRTCLAGWRQQGLRRLEALRAMLRWLQGLLAVLQ